MKAVPAVLLGVLLYAVLCVCIAVIRAIFSKAGKRKQNFKETFWSFFLETLNPLNWI